MSLGSHLSLCPQKRLLWHLFYFSVNGEGQNYAQSTELPPTERRLGCGPAELAL